MNDLPGRIPPHSDEAEKSVLSSMMQSDFAVDQVMQVLKSPQEFHIPGHRLIFEAMLSLSQRGAPIDFIQVADELALLGKRTRMTRDYLAEVGGHEYLQQISMFSESFANVDHHARIIRGKALLRNVIQEASGLLESAWQPGAEAEELINEAENAFFKLSQGTEASDFVAMDTLVKDLWQRLEDMDANKSLLGVPTGLVDLDKLTQGWQKTDLIILAARPSMGKTALALNLMMSAAKSDTPAIMFSLEMGVQQLGFRLLSTMSTIESQRIRTKSLKPNDFRLMSKAMNELGKLPILIDETPGITLSELRSKARRAVSSHKVGLIIIDYLQLMTIPKSESHQLGVAMISKSLKGLAKELDVPIIALSQLSRAVEQRGGDKRPMLSDLRDSGAIEQDADLVMFVYRPEMYEATDSEGNPTEGRAEVILGKHRNGATGIVNLFFDKTIGCFSDFDSFHQAPQSGGGSAVETNAPASKGVGNYSASPPPLPKDEAPPF
jgi:replicative DNA helicase